MVGGGGSSDEYDGDGRQQQQRGQGGGSSRWNPTKEQIRLLEGMYSRGLRTPSAEQIQHITRTLNKHGHIQGKNVFYWFQNHKARQRQKHHKHNQLHINDNYFPYFNHHYPPPFPPFFPPPQPTTPVVGSPCHIPNEHLGFYHQFPKVQPPPAQESVNETTDLMLPTTQWYNQSMPGYPTSQYQQQTFHLNSPTQDSWMRHPQQTLDLFPMHPTGILQTRNYIEIHDEEEEEDKSRPNAVPNTHTCSNNNRGTDDHDHYAFFDFLCRE